MIMRMSLLVALEQQNGIGRAAKCQTAQVEVYRIRPEGSGLDLDLILILICFNT